MWTMFLLLFSDPVAGASELPEDVAYECPEDLSPLPDLLRRRCREAIALQVSSGAGGTRPVIVLPAAAAAAAGIALSNAKGDPPVSR